MNNSDKKTRLEGMFFSKNRHTKKGGGRLHKINNSVLGIPRVDPRDSRPLTQRIMEKLGCNRSKAKQVLRKHS